MDTNYQTRHPSVFQIPPPNPTAADTWVLLGIPVDLIGEILVAGQWVEVDNLCIDDPNAPHAGHDNWLFRAKSGTASISGRLSDISCVKTKGSRKAASFQ